MSVAVTQAAGAGGLPIGANPTLGELLSLRFDPLIWLALLLVGGWYVYGFIRSRQSPQGRQSWPTWRAVIFALAWFLTLIATQSQAITVTANSMALYMGRLMVLAEVVPPLAVLALPRLNIAPHTTLGKLLGFFLDPWVALALWSAIIIFWNLPAGFNASIVSNTAAAFLPALYLLGGLLVWAVVLRPFPTIQGRSYGNRGWFGLLAALPMMLIASVWLYSREVLYSPYVSALCLWNLSPLQNQQISGWIMMLAGLPGIALAFGQLFAWLISLSDGGDGGPEGGEVA